MEVAAERVCAVVMVPEYTMRLVIGYAAAMDAQLKVGLAAQLAAAAAVQCERGEYGERVGPQATHDCWAQSLQVQVQVDVLKDFCG